MKIKELTDGIKAVSTEVAKFDQIAAGIAALEKAHPRDVACDVASTTGMKQAVAGRAAWRTPRLAVEAARKTAKAPVLELGRQIDTFAKELTATLLLGEEHYDEQIKAEEARKERERQAKAEAERARVAAILERISLFTFPESFGLNSSANIQEALDALEKNAPGDEFQEFKAKAQAAHENGVAALRRMLAGAIQREQEAARRAEEAAAERARLKEEQEKIRLEREELARLRAEQAQREAAEQKRLRDERMQAEAEQRRLDEEAAQRRRQEDLKAQAAREAADRIAAEQRAEKQRLLEAAQAEQRKKEQQARAEAEAKEKAESEARRKEEERAQQARTRLHNAAQELLDALILAIPFVTDKKTLEQCVAAVDKAEGNRHVER